MLPIPSIGHRSRTTSLLDPAATSPRPRAGRQPGPSGPRGAGDARATPRCARTPCSSRKPSSASSPRSGESSRCPRATSSVASPSTFSPICRPASGVRCWSGSPRRRSSIRSTRRSCPSTYGSAADPATLGPRNAEGFSLGYADDLAATAARGSTAFASILEEPAERGGPPPPLDLLYAEASQYIGNEGSGPDLDRGRERRHRPGVLAPRSRTRRECSRSRPARERSRSGWAIPAAGS